MSFAFDQNLEFYVLMADLAFIGFAATALLGGVIAVGAQRLIHAVLGLATAMVGVAGLYVYLGTHFIAAMQILIYVGAVCISLVFAVMLARPPQEAELAGKTPIKIALGSLTALFAALLLGTAVMHHPWEAAQKITSMGSIKEVGFNLLTRYALVFELISVVLLVAIVGSVVIAKRGRGTPGTPGGGDS